MKLDGDYQYWDADEYDLETQMTESRRRYERRAQNGAILKSADDAVEPAR